MREGELARTHVAGARARLALIRALLPRRRRRERELATSHASTAAGVGGVGAAVGMRRDHLVVEAAGERVQLVGHRLYLAAELLAHQVRFVLQFGDMALDVLREGMVEEVRWRWWWWWRRR